jgi:hypothetical protein
MHSISSTFICLTEEEQAAASQGELSVEAMQRKEEDFVGQEYKKVFTKSFFIGLEIEKKPSKSLDPAILLAGTKVLKADPDRGLCQCPDTQPLLPKQAILQRLPAVGQIR